MLRTFASAVANHLYANVYTGQQALDTREPRPAMAWNGDAVNAAGLVNSKDLPSLLAEDAFFDNLDLLEAEDTLQQLGSSMGPQHQLVTDANPSSDRQRSLTDILVI